jgi:hypothetical protein
MLIFQLAKENPDKSSLMILASIVLGFLVAYVILAKLKVLPEQIPYPHLQTIHKSERDHAKEMAQMGYDHTKEMAQMGYDHTKEMDKSARDDAKSERDHAKETAQMGYDHTKEVAKLQSDHKQLPREIENGQ